eukprot:TRINITY_DN1571_c3_g1_i1.p1 TRINITY_DN1571_c3_g1~~TRINITY_DN1571_c3_g1_i1.p1  ORF type:complete len:139 (-),score=9.89 TRINITY_DN1571_c3_g1_i1:367-783(-)
MKRRRDTTPTPHRAGDDSLGENSQSLFIQASLIASSSLTSTRTHNSHHSDFGSMSGDSVTSGTGTGTTQSPRMLPQTPMQSPQLFSGSDPFLTFPPPSHPSLGPMRPPPPGRYSPRGRVTNSVNFRPRAVTSPATHPF